MRRRSRRSLCLAGGEVGHRTGGSACDLVEAWMRGGVPTGDLRCTLARAAEALRTTSGVSVVEGRIHSLPRSFGATRPGCMGIWGWGRGAV